MEINVDKLLIAHELIEHFNSLDLSEVDLIKKDGKKIIITEEQIAEWKFVGLSNMYFLLQILEEE